MVQKAHSAHSGACQKARKACDVTGGETLPEKNEGVWKLPKAKTRGQKANPETGFKV